MLIATANLTSHLSKRGQYFGQMLKYFNRIVFACDIGLGCYIPRSCKFFHAGLGCVFHENAKVGERCFIYPGVVLGASGRKGEGHLAPIIGDDVVLCAGAKILGNVHVGNGSIVAANAVVINDVPEYVLVAGVPASIRKHLENEIREKP